jgi:putative phosphoribosyl transferase
MGAIAFPDILILNQDLITQLHIASEAIEATITTEKQELSRRAKLYLGARQPPEIAAKTVILVDDGIATGATMKAAIAAIRSQHPSSIIVAVPVASSQSCLEIEPLVEHLLCLESSLELSSISRWYLDFSQTTDREVCQLLDLADKLISSHS